MNVSSYKRLAVLERTSLRQIQWLVGTLHRSTLHRTQFIEARYKEHAQYFSETLQFLKDLGWVCEDGEQLTISDEGRSVAASLTDEGYVAEKITQAMSSPSNAYGNALAEYLGLFKVIGDEVTHRPLPQRRLQESTVRNFLMDMRMVFYRKDDDTFVLSRNFVHLYFWAKNVTGQKSKERLQALSSMREQLGSSAEYAVFQYEKIRVGEQLAAQVEYVSDTYPFACYDVKSVSLNNDSSIPRYIEVKAVSADSYEFFWSSSELEAARFLENEYFLYLLPVVDGTFDFSKLLILENPYITVYKNSDNWLTEENVIVCRRKQPKEVLSIQASESH